MRLEGMCITAVVQLYEAQKARIRHLDVADQFDELARHRRVHGCGVPSSSSVEKGAEEFHDTSNNL